MFYRELRAPFFLGGGMTKQYTAIIDVDTLLVHAALAGQETSVIVKHKKTG